MNGEPLNLKSLLLNMLIIVQLLMDQLSSFEKQNLN